MEIEPLNSSLYANEANVYANAHRYAEAVDSVNAAITIAESGKNWNNILGMINIYQGMFEQGLEEIRSAVDQPQVGENLALLAYALGRAGRKKEALDTVVQLERKAKHDPVWVAIAWTGIGNNDKAIEWLNRALVARSSGELWIGVFPCLDPLRPDPRFKDIIRRMGLPE